MHWNGIQSAIIPTTVAADIGNNTTPIPPSRKTTKKTYTKGRSRDKHANNDMTRHDTTRRDTDADANTTLRTQNQQ